jgi:hypothetical protein
MSIVFLLTPKNWKFILISMVVLILIFSIVTSWGSIVSSFKNIGNFGQCPKGIVPQVIEFQNTCHPWAETNCVLELDSGSLWGDGIKVGLYDYMGKMQTYSEDFPVVVCNKGSSEGQNVNYFYCGNLVYSKSSQLISSTGVVGKNEVGEYNIDLVLQEINASNSSRPPKNAFGLEVYVPPTHSYFKVISSTCKIK